jgi:hypothetical protein
MQVILICQVVDVDSSFHLSRALVNTTCNRIFFKIYPLLQSYNLYIFYISTVN